MVYLLLLAAVGVTVLNYLFGDFIFLRADGLVLRDRSTIAVTFVARVVAVDVKEGQEVSEGSILLQLESTEMLERLADLSSRRAQLATSAVTLRARAEQVTQLLPLAERRELETSDALRSVSYLAELGLITATRQDQALGASFDALQDRVRLSTEGKELTDGLVVLENAQKDAETALLDLKRHYANGVVRSPVSGAVGATVPSVGDVYRPGETILSIYSGEAYVQAYLPQRYLLPIRTGMKVEVTDGRDSTVGVIDEILPVTDLLPSEFQNMFKPLDRNQLAKIRFSDPPPFPLNQKVRVTRPIF